MNGVRLPAALSLCIALGFAAGPAQPSQRPINGQMIPDRLEYPLDSISPAPPVIAVESIERAYGTIRTDSLRVDNSDCCTSTITLLVSGAHDNGTQVRKLGYRYHFIDGTLPGNFDLPKGAWLADHGHLWLTSGDGGAWKQAAFSFRLAVTAVDHAGNESARSNIIRIEHDGDTSAKRRDVESRLGVWSGETMPSPAAGADTLLKGPDNGGSEVGVGPIPMRIEPIARRAMHPDSTLRSVDTTPPSRVTGLRAEVVRGYGGSWRDWDEHAWIEGDNTGWLSITYRHVEDDQTSLGEIGYRVEIVDGAPPAGLEFPPGPVLGPSVPYAWDDGDTWSQEPFSFRVIMKAVDAAGNESVPSDTLLIADDGSNHRRRMERMMGMDDPVPPPVRRVVATVIADRDTVTTGDSLFVEIRVENQGDSTVGGDFKNSCTIGLHIENAEGHRVSGYNCHQTGCGITIPGGTVVFIRYGIAIVPGRQLMLRTEVSMPVFSGQLRVDWPSMEGRVVPGTYYLAGGLIHPRYPAGRKVIVVR